jgi:hypothetical protein
MVKGMLCLPLLDLWSGPKQDGQPLGMDALLARFHQHFFTFLGGFTFERVY